MPNVMDNYRKLHQQALSAVQEQQSRQPIRIQVGSATCENAAGAAAVVDAFKKLLAKSGRKDIELRVTGCTGRCSREPIVSVSLPGQMPAKYQHVDAALAERICRHALEGKLLEEGRLETDQPVVKFQFLFCGGARCGRAEENDFRTKFQAKLLQAGFEADQVSVTSANCFGLCRLEDLGKVDHILVLPSKVLYRVANEADLDEIVQKHVKGGQVVERLRLGQEPLSQRFYELYGDVAFFNQQSRLALRNSGVINPESIEQYVYYDGFRGLAKALDRGDPQWVIDQVTQSKLRGRGGAGYPTGLKWSQGRQNKSPTRYVICNADEGDPGAFMDRDMLESDPFSVLEGMLIAAFAVGASQGFFYIRAEYPMAIKRVEKAIAEARKHGLLGENILESQFSFEVEVRLGAGAFVCGEETALIASIEGRRGWPRIRPPYPAQSGLWGLPTVINNVETYANVPIVIDYGPEWFSQIGSQVSGGTKVFALAGKVRHTGLVEVPMGSTLRQIVFDIGGGVPGGKQLKAIQTGGPAGGTIPAQWADTKVDYDSLTQAGSIMGSGGMIVMDEDDCMVDIARFFMTFSQDESCGQCTPCREGTMRMLEILERIAQGQGQMSDLDKLQRLGKLMRKASLCGLGRAAANPVLSTLRHFREEYLAHVRDKHCPAGKCRFEKKGLPVMPYQPDVLRKA